MTNTEANSLYENLNKLLEDICTFLTQETQNGRLSANAKAIAKELIDRSKIQLQEISKITQTYDGDDRYVDMHCPKGDEEAVLQEDEQIYESLDEFKRRENGDDYLLKYADLPAKEMSCDIKCGKLVWKTKSLFKRSMRVYAGIQKSYFLMYSNEKSNKPLQIIDLKQSKVLNDDTSKEPKSFRLHSSAFVFQFIAPSFSEMKEWTDAMNRFSDVPTEGVTLVTKARSKATPKPVAPPKPPVPKEQTDSAKTEENDEEIYDRVVQVSYENEPLNHATHMYEDDSVTSTYDPVQTNADVKQSECISTEKNKLSISDILKALIPGKHKIKSSKETSDEDRQSLETYDVIQNENLRDSCNHGIFRALPSEPVDSSNGQIDCEEYAIYDTLVKDDYKEDENTCLDQPIYDCLQATEYGSNEDLQTYEECSNNDEVKKVVCEERSSAPPLPVKQKDVVQQNKTFLYPNFK